MDGSSEGKQKVALRQFHCQRSTLDHIGQSKTKKKDVHQIESIKVHPLFNGTCGGGYDIGLVKLKKAIKLKKNRTESSCLELSYNNGYFNDQLLLVGYGSNRTTDQNTSKYSHLKIGEQMPIESRLIHGSLIDGSVCNGKANDDVKKKQPVITDW